MIAPALLCLALNAYHEARSEPFIGQVAVGQVALRRAKHRPERVCAEIYKPHQFSWTATRPRGSSLPHRHDPAWQTAIRAARVALLWSMGAPLPDYSAGATHYHAVYVSPSWARRKQLAAEIGQHRFLRGTPK